MKWRWKFLKRRRQGARGWVRGMVRHLRLTLRHLNLRPRKEVPRRSSLPRRTRTWTNHSLHNVIYIYADDVIWNKEEVILLPAYLWSLVKGSNFIHFNSMLQI